MLRTSLSVERDGSTFRMSFPGDILSTNANQLWAEITELLGSAAANSPGWTHLEADLSSARMVDSVGLNLLVSLFKALQARSKGLRIRVTSQHVRRTLKFARVDQMAEVVGE